VPRAHVPDLLAGADVLVSATQPDRREALDKAVLEAAACGVPVLSSNAALEPLLADLPLRLRFPARDAEALAGLLADLAAAEPAVRREAGAELRRRVVAGHSVDGWADQVVALVRRLGDRPAGGNRRRRA
jgi:glycosyltransferase involved in cell wall biosynthesis